MARAPVTTRPQLVLASSSPRRASLLQKAGISFVVSRPENVEDAVEQYDSPRDLAQSLARAKARSVARGLRSGFVLGCDTVVAIGQTVLGKPTSADDARRMLSLLAGRWHSVITGLCLIDAATSGELIDYEETEVKMTDLDPQEIKVYVASGEPFDKAGAYGIQGGASLFVTGLRGPLDNVIGLPVRLVRRMLTKMGMAE